MIFFVMYAVLFWYLAATHRRSWEGFLWIALGLFGLVVVGFLHYRLNIWTGGRIYIQVLQVLLYPYAAAVTTVGLFIVLLPQRPAVHCRGCKYDLAGLDPGPTRCPECGRPAVVPEPEQEVELIGKPDPRDVPSRRRLMKAQGVTIIARRPPMTAEDAEDSARPVSSR